MSNRVSRVRALGSVIVGLVGAAVLLGGAVRADPNQDQHFLDLLAQEEIPAVENVPTLIAVAHRICRQLDGGMPAGDVVDDLRSRMYNGNPLQKLYPDRVTRTMDRFVIAAVTAYCPSDRGKIASLTAIRTPLPDAETPGAMLVSLLRPASAVETMPRGEIPPPNPPQLPTPVPPANLETPPPPVAAPPPRHVPAAPQQVPPPPQAPPPPQQAEPPAAGPPPGDGNGGSGGDGTDGGGGPAEPPADAPLPPGFVKLAP